MTDLAWKDAARHWWELTVKLRAELEDKLPTGAYVRRDVFDAVAEAHDSVLDECNQWRLEALRLRDERSKVPAWLDHVCARIREAEAKHPRDDWKDGTCTNDTPLYFGDALAKYPLESRRRAVVANEMHGSVEWLDILLCEVHELAREEDDARIMDELLDVIVVALRWYMAKARKAGRRDA